MFLQNTNATAVVESEDIVHESMEMLFADMIAVVQESEIEWQNIQAGAMLQEHNAILSEDAEGMKKAVGGAVESIKKWFAKAYEAAKKFFAKVFAKIKEALGVDKRWLDANRAALSKATGSVKLYKGLADGSAAKGFSALANKAQKKASKLGSASADELSTYASELKTEEVKALLGAKVTKEVKGVELLKQIGTVASIGGSIAKLGKIVDTAAKGAQAKFKGDDKVALTKAKVAYSAIQTYVASLVTAYNGMRADLMAAMRGVIGNKVADGKTQEDRKAKLGKGKSRLATLKGKEQDAQKAKAKNESVAEGEEPVEVVELSEAEMTELKDLLLAEAMGTLEESEEVVETEEASETSEVVVEGEELEVDLFADELAAE